MQTWISLFRKKPIDLALENSAPVFWAFHGNNFKGLKKVSHLWAVSLQDSPPFSSEINEVSRNVEKALVYIIAYY